jgi:hypothetical protein
MTDWENEVRQMLKSELARNGVGYRDLVLLLKGIGVIETESSIANKISRGKFSCIFFIQALRAIGVDTVSVAARARNSQKSKPPGERLEGHTPPRHEHSDDSLAGQKSADSESTKL